MLGVLPNSLLIFVDNLKCVCRDLGLLLHAARFTNGHVRTSKVVRGGVRNWVLSEDGDKWTVKMDVRDLERHLDTTRRGLVCTCSSGYFSVGFDMGFPAGFSWPSSSC